MVTVIVNVSYHTKFNIYENICSKSGQNLGGSEQYRKNFLQKLKILYNNDFFIRRIPEACGKKSFFWDQSSVLVLENFIEKLERVSIQVF
jgi:hypothetical protein